MKPIVKYVKWLDIFKGKNYFVSGMALFPFVLLHKNLEYTVDGYIKENHESIHFEQQKELFVIGFYLIYVFEFVRNLFHYKSSYKAYKNISFEREAFTNEANLNYLDKREKYAFKKFRGVSPHADNV